MCVASKSCAESAAQATCKECSVLRSLCCALTKHTSKVSQPFPKFAAASRAAPQGGRGGPSRGEGTSPPPAKRPRLDAAAAAATHSARGPSAAPRPAAAAALSTTSPTSSGLPPAVAPLSSPAPALAVAAPPCDGLEVGSLALPWASPPDRVAEYLTSLPRAPLLRLHEEILDFVRFLAPTVEEQAAAECAVKAATDVILSVFHGVTVEAFGSRVTGVVLPSSDWDLVVIGVPHTPMNLRRLGQRVRASGVALDGSLEVIERARVPLVKFREARTGIQIDISFQDAQGIRIKGAPVAVASREVVMALLTRYPAARPLAVVIKYFLAQHGLNETFNGGVGSFLLTMMCVHIVQRKLAEYGLQPHSGLDALPEGLPPPPPAAAVPPAAVCFNLGALLLSFLELYAFNLNVNTAGALVQDLYGGYYAASGYREPNRLAFDSPVMPGTDVGGNSYAFTAVREAFQRAHTRLARLLREWPTEAAAAAAATGTALVLPSMLSRFIFPDKLLRMRAKELSAMMGVRLRAAAGAAAAAAAVVASSGAVAAPRGSGGGGATAAAPPPVPVAAASVVEEEERGSTDLGAAGAVAGAGSAPAPPTATAAAPDAPAPAPAAPLSEEEARAVSAAAAEALLAEHSNVKIRHARLLADILTRKARGVEEKVRQQSLQGWY